MTEKLGYDSIELSDEQVDKLFGDEDSDILDEINGMDEQPADAEESTGELNEEEDPETSDKSDVEKDDESHDTEKEPETFEVNGEHLTIDELRQGHLRHSDYTKGKQEISNQLKELSKKQSIANDFLSFASKVKGNSDLTAILRDTIVDELGEEAAEQFVKSMNMEPVENPEIAEMKVELEKYQMEHKANESRKQMEIEIRSLAKSEKVPESLVKEAYDYAVNRFIETDRKEVISLKTALKVIRAEKGLNHKPNESKKVIRKGTVGIKKVGNAKPKNYDDIDIDMDQLLSS